MTRFVTAIALVGFAFAVSSAQAGTNSWIDGSDFWNTDGDWSLGISPSTNDFSNYITNSANKTVTIDNFVPSSNLIISNLTLSAPVNSTNTLAMASSGLSTPLRILNGFTIATGGILRMTNSFLRVDGLSTGQFSIDGAVRMTNSIAVTTNTVTVVGASGFGSVNVAGGTWSAKTIILGGGAGSQATFAVTRGAVSVANLLGTGVLDVRGGTLTFGGGTNSADSLFLTNGTSSVLVYTGGVLKAQNATFANGAVLQFALGTNSIPAAVSNLTLGGTLNVTDGGGFTTNTYVLFSYSGAFAYNGLAIGTTPSVNFSYAISTSSNGFVDLVVTVNTNNPPLTAFQQWQVLYFGSTTNPAAAATADPDGDGQNNLAEFYAGTDPTNNASAFRITSLARQGTDFVVTWTTAGGSTNIVQATNGAANGSFSNNFSDISSSIVIPGTGIITTNYTDAGGATNFPSRFYRVNLLAGNAASDDAANAAYNGGWNNGNNGGYGLGPWIFRATSAFNGAGDGFFIGSSTNNASVTPPGIDTGGKSWGMYANSGNTAVAFRVFANGPLLPGQSFLINFDNGFIDSNRNVGVVLRTGTASSNTGDAMNGARFVFQFTGQDPNGVYRIVDAGGVENTGVPYTGQGLRLKFTLTGSNTYTLQTIDNASSTVYTFSGTLSGSGTVDSIALFSNNAGNGPLFDTFFNSLQVTGLPSP